MAPGEGGRHVDLPLAALAPVLIMAQAGSQATAASDQRARTVSVQGCPCQRLGCVQGSGQVERA